MRLYPLLLALMIILSASCSPQVAMTIPTEPATFTPPPTRTPTITLTPSLTPTITPQPTSPVDDLKGITIIFWYPWLNETAANIENLITLFNASNPYGVQVVGQGFGNNTSLSDTLMTSSGNAGGPNIIIAPIEQLNYLHQKYSSLVNLQDYTSLPGFGISAQEIQDIPAVFWEQDAYGDYRLGLPATRNAQILFYNQTWGNNLSFSQSPSSLDTFRDQSCAALQANLNDAIFENNGTGGWIINTQSLSLLSWFYAFGAAAYPDQENIAYNFASDTIENSLTYLSELYTSGCAWVSRDPSPYDYFAQRYSLVFSGSTADIPTVTQRMALKQNPDTWTVIPYPRPDGSPILLVNGSSYAILKSDSRQQLAAWLFIRWLSQPEQAAQMINATGTLPTRLSAVDLVLGYSQTYPQWDAAVHLLSYAQPAPRLSSWRQVRLILSDAGGNIFNPRITPTPIPFILQQLETTIPEVLTLSP